MNGSLATWTAIVILTLVVWLFFYYASEPLSGPATTVVAGFSVALVYGIKWLGRVLVRRREQK
jgi:hypothetical protein